MEMSLVAVNWTEVRDWADAGGTVAAALAAAWAAWAAARAANATADQAQYSRQALDLELRPHLARVRGGAIAKQTGSEVRAGLEVESRGRGTARILAYGVRSDPPGSFEIEHGKSPDKAREDLPLLLGPGETRDIRVIVPQDACTALTTAVRLDRSFLVWVEHADVRGEQRVRSEFQVLHEDGQWRAKEHLVAERTDDDA